MLSLFFEFENKPYRYYLNRISTRDKVISRETNELNQICTASRSSHLKRIVPSYEIPYRSKQFIYFESLAVENSPPPPSEYFPCNLYFSLEK